MVTVDVIGTAVPDVVVGELGRLTVWVNGEERSVRGQRSQAVLALLVLRGSAGASMDYLVEHVWTDRPPTARRSLANVVRRLRGLMGADCIATRGPTYQIADHVRSHRQFLLAAAERATHGEFEPTQAVAAARELYGLWRDEPWLGFEDISPFLGDRTMLRDARLRLLAAAASAANSLDEATAASEFLRTLVEERPHHERWWLDLVAAVALSGVRVTGLRLLQSARSSLDQVGLLPSAEFFALERDLLGVDEPRSTPELSRPGERLGAPTLRVSEDLPFVGRDDELDRLVDDQTQAPHAAVTLIEGPAGAGKTRLMVEAGRRCRNHVVLSGRCEQPGRSLLGPVLQILEEYVASATDTDLADVLDGFGSVLSDYLPGVHSLPGMRADVDRAVPSLVDERERLVHACISVLLRAGTRRPHLILIDDLQWGSDVVIDIVEGLANRADSSELAVMATSRDDRSGVRPKQRLTALLTGPSRTHVSLGPLQHADLRSILAASGADLDVDDLEARSGGNAFFVAELVRASVEVVDQETLSRLVCARVAMVHLRAVEFLATAALCGLDFDPWVVGQSLSLEPDATDEIVDRLARNQLLLSQHGTRGRFTFAHGLVAEAVLSSMSTRDRRQMHLRIADVEQRAGSPAHVWVEHLVEAGPLVDPHTLAAAAVEATRQAVHERRPDAAIGVLQRVLEMHLGPIDQVKVMRWLAAAMFASQVPGGEAILLRASEIALAEGFDTELGALALVYATGGPWRSNSDSNGRRLLNLALERCPADNERLRLQLEARVACFDIFSGPLDARVHASKRALAIAQKSGDSQALGTALNAAIVAASCPAMVAQTRVFEDDLLRLEDAGLAFSEMRNRPAISTFWLADGDRYRSDVEARRANASSATHRERQTLNAVETVLAIIEDDLVRARRLLDEQASDNDVDRGNNAWNRVAIEWLDGHVVEAFDVVRRCYDDFRGGPLRYTLLWLAIEAEEHRLADELYETINPRRIARLPELFLGGFGLAGLAMTAVTLRDKPLIEMLQPVLGELSGQMIGVPWSSLPSADFFLAVLAAAASEHSLAQRHKARAIAVHERMGAPAFTRLLDRYVTAP